MKSTITIELQGSFIARHVESGTTIDMNPRKNMPTTKSAIPPLCRKLLNHGFDREARVHVIRKALDRDGFIPVFKRDRSLGTWADLDITESEASTLRTIKYRPFPDAVKAKNSRKSPEGIFVAPAGKRSKIALTAHEEMQVPA